MRKTALFLSIVLLISAFTVIGGCSSEDSGGSNESTGTLQFYANGEDFVREGFVSKDGWEISFDNLYIVLADITAYQTDPAYDAHSEEAIEGDVEAALSGTHTVNLAAGDENADPILVGTINNVETGHYNAIYWKMPKATSGSAAGYSMVISGTAEKDEQNIDFTISIEEEYEYSCGEYVGDERKGIVSEGGAADLEMTFHFDHLFGDYDSPADDHVNTGALGFDPFAALAVDDVVDEDMASLETGLSAADYELLTETLITLGHVGEGHCLCE